MLAGSAGERHAGVAVVPLASVRLVQLRPSPALAKALGRIVEDDDLRQRLAADAVDHACPAFLCQRTLEGRQLLADYYDFSRSVLKLY